MIAITAFSSLAGFLFLNTLYLQDGRGHSALHAGLYTLPMAAMTVICAPLSGRITGQRGPRIPLLAAGVMTTAGALMMGVTAATPVAWLMLAYVVFGIGNGMVNPPISNTAVSGMPVARPGWPPPWPRPAARWAARWGRADRVGGGLGAAWLVAHGFHPGQPRRLADHRGLRLAGAGGRAGHQRPVGARHRRAHGRAG